MKSEKEKMLAGELYNAFDPELAEERLRCRKLCRALNESPADDLELRRKILNDLFGYESDVWIEPPFFCDYGTNIRLGEKVFFNFNCVILDVMPVSIGNRVLFGPAVQIYTATHPLEAEKRRSGLEFAKPIGIGDDVWIGGGAILSPGISIGARTVIGAGSVVTRSIPSDVFAAGNPCRVIRELGED